MIYHCCGDCGERWLIGNPRTCKCPEEKPQRTWANLTSGEIGEIYRVGWASNMELARAIEAKLKEKNT